MLGGGNTRCLFEAACSRGRFFGGLQGEGMVRIGMNYKVLPGKEEVFERAFSCVLGVMFEMEDHKIPICIVISPNRQAI